MNPSTADADSAVGDGDGYADGGGDDAFATMGSCGCAAPALSPAAAATACGFGGGDGAAAAKLLASKVAAEAARARETSGEAPRPPLQAPRAAQLLRPPSTDTCGAAGGNSPSESPPIPNAASAAAAAGSPKPPHSGGCLLGPQIVAAAQRASGDALPTRAPPNCAEPLPSLTPVARAGAGVGAAPGASTPSVDVAAQLSSLLYRASQLAAALSAVKVSAAGGAEVGAAADAVAVTATAVANALAGCAADDSEDDGDGEGEGIGSMGGAGACPGSTPAKLSVRSATVPISLPPLRLTKRGNSGAGADASAPSLLPISLTGAAARHRSCAASDGGSKRGRGCTLSTGHGAPSIGMAGKAILAGLSVSSYLQMMRDPEGTSRMNTTGEVRPTGPVRISDQGNTPRVTPRSTPRTTPRSRGLVSSQPSTPPPPGARVPPHSPVRLAVGNVVGLSRWRRRASKPLVEVDHERGADDASRSAADNIPRASQKPFERGSSVPLSSFKSDLRQQSESSWT